MSGIGAIVFYFLVALTLGGGFAVAFSRNIVRSAFALLATFIGVAGLYATLSADFVAIIQALVYVGGILIVILFAVMLTSRLDEIGVSNPSIGVPAALVTAAIVTGLLIASALTAPWSTRTEFAVTPTTSSIGDALLGPYVLPFELISVLLLAALLGAVTLAKAQSKKPDPNVSSVDWVKK